jgi:folate-binding Fe-S cluster repair protein YgfZ
VEGVNFKKGCYPGQEVVARSQFRGTLKRRAYIAHCDQAMQAGQEVFSNKDASQPCGKVAQVASDGATHVGIVELQISAIEGARLHLASAEGAELHLLDLPYPLRDDI